MSNFGMQLNLWVKISTLFLIMATGLLEGKVTDGLLELQKRKEALSRLLVK